MGWVENGLELMLLYKLLISSMQEASWDGEGENCFGYGATHVPCSPCPVQPRAALASLVPSVLEAAFQLPP